MGYEYRISQSGSNAMYKLTQLLIQIGLLGSSCSSFLKVVASLRMEICNKIPYYYQIKRLTVLLKLVILTHHGSMCSLLAHTVQHLNFVGLNFRCFHGYNGFRENYSTKISKADERQWASRPSPAPSANNILSPQVWQFGKDFRQGK